MARRGLRAMAQVSPSGLVLWLRCLSSVCSSGVFRRAMAQVPLVGLWLRCLSSGYGPGASRRAMAQVYRAIQTDRGRAMAQVYRAIQTDRGRAMAQVYRAIQTDRGRAMAQVRPERDQGPRSTGHVGCGCASSAISGVVLPMGLRDPT
jgi:hypothetical protein